MKLNRETYEAWLLDRMEGQLSPAQEKELDAFLRANPDLLSEAGTLPNVVDDGTEFPWKKLLHKAYPPTGEPDTAR